VRDLSHGQQHGDEEGARRGARRALRRHAEAAAQEEAVARAHDLHRDGAPLPAAARLLAQQRGDDGGQCQLEAVDQARPGRGQGGQGGGGARERGAVARRRRRRRRRARLLLRRRSRRLFCAASRERAQEEEKRLLLHWRRREEGCVGGVARAGRVVHLHPRLPQCRIERRQRLARALSRRRRPPRRAPLCPRRARTGLAAAAQRGARRSAQRRRWPCQPPQQLVRLVQRLRA